ncbi:MAG: FliH/SctL family protein [Novosphingobium sp.]
MSDLFTLGGRGSGGFSRDLRFTSNALAPRPVEPEVDAPDPLASAYAEGYAAGAAQAAAEAEAREMIDEAARRHFAFSFSKLDADLAEALRDKMHQTVTALCESVLHPLALDAGALARRVETAVAMFVRADDERVIRLHPDDLTLVAGKLPPDWTFVPDAALERGALRVETATGGIEDGPIQWRAAITEALRLC